MIQRKVLFAFITIIFNQLLFSQVSDYLKVKSYKLENGFSVFLNEDHSANKVFGAVMVNAGAKHESPDATGMAHYLEHLLFKGTDKMGTSNYVKEKPYLDSINVLYSELARTRDIEKQAGIQKKINKQALESSKYGLPNEFDKLLRSIGSTGINAFTNYEMTFYHNSFPSHEIEKWLNIYATRFQNPVFRSFQSELEVVYEEKNRAMDNMERKIVRKTESLIFPDIPYGQWSVLGKVEHLKKPSLIKMYDFYNKNYVAGNMAIILSGNFNSEDVLPLIKEKFANLNPGYVENKPLTEPIPLKGDHVDKVRMTPVKAGFLGWRTISQNHPDRLAMDVCEYLLFNESETGLINQILLNNEMIYTGAFSNVYNEAGDFVIYYVPKILVQSIGNAEKLIVGALDKVKNGDFSNEMLMAAKFELANSFLRDLEELNSRGIMIGDAFNTGKSWEEYIAYPEKIKNISKEEVMRVAKTYLNDKKIKMISRTGFSKKKKLVKPSFKAVLPDQKKSSVYAIKFNKIPPKSFKPKYIDFNNSIERVTFSGGHELIASKNPINDLFTLEIRFKTGILQNTNLSVASGLMNYAGAGSYSLAQLKQAFASLGCNYSIKSDDNFLNFTLKGSESSLIKALELTNLILTKPNADDKAIKLLYNEVKTNGKVEKRNRSLLGRALLNYGVYGKNSPYLIRKSAKDVNKLVAEDLVANFKQVVNNYQSEIVFSGNMPIDQLKNLIDDKLSLSKDSKADKFIKRKAQEIKKNKILFVHDKNAVQSQIYFYIPGEEMNLNQHSIVTAFNEYFGGGFSGLVMQEIREYRSLAYSTWARYFMPPIPNEKALFVSYIGCQGDKSVEAIKVMAGLINDMPEKSDRIPTMKTSLQLKVVTNYPNFREISDRIINYQRQGYEQDPNIQSFNEYENLQMKNIVEFYNNAIKGKPHIITIYGDRRNINFEELKYLGEVIELDVKDIINF